jgi:hypothetical protein
VAISLAVMTPCMAHSEEPPAIPLGVDHLVYGVPELDVGVQEIEGLLGVRPVPGGRHPDYGTHNALLSLGPATYLEIIAPDPELPRPERGRPFGLDALDRPRLLTWVLRSEAIEELAGKAARAGVPLGPIQSGSREKPDGTLLSWKLTDPYALPLGGAIPFLIAWGNTPHPAAAAPLAGELIGLRLEHPEPDSARRVLGVLGVEMDVERAGEPQIVARIQSPRGLVELR